jgi:MoxR-like ATPase
MLLNRQAGFSAKRLDIARMQSVTTVAEILTARQAAKKVQVSEAIIDYLLALVRASRQYPDLALGASPRAAGAWLQTSQVVAWMAGRDYVTPDDVKGVALPLLRHRLILKAEALLDGLQIDGVIASLLNKVAVPR